MNLFFRLQSKIWHYTIYDMQSFCFAANSCRTFQQCAFRYAHSRRTSMQMNNVDKCEWKFMNSTNIMKLYLNWISYEDWNTPLIFVSEKFSYVQKNSDLYRFILGDFHFSPKWNKILSHIISKVNEIMFISCERKWNDYSSNFRESENLFNECDSRHLNGSCYWISVWQP